jgi:hypothetical protein
MRSRDPNIWFPAKTYGWGWGLPCAWQGWLVLVCYLALMLGGIFLIQPDAHPVFFAVYTVALSLILIAICWWKGEPPAWRWGRRD